MRAILIERQFNHFHNWYERAPEEMQMKQEIPEKCEPKECD